jgi:hypothetical protein
VELVVPENEPMPGWEAWKEVAVNEEEPLRTKLGGGMAEEAMITRWS